MPGRSDDRYLVEPHRWLFANICTLHETFYDALEDHLVREYGSPELIRSVCAYQHAILTLPGYDQRLGKQADCEHDWIRYFETLEAGETSPGLPEPCDGALSVTDTGWDDRNGRSDYDWPVGDTSESWTAWFNCVACGRLSPMKSNHQELTLRPREIEAERTEVRIRA